MTYRIEFVNQSAKQFRTLPVQIQEQLKAKIDALSTNPRPYDGITKLAGEDDLYRIRSSDYRIIYTTDVTQKLTSPHPPTPFLSWKKGSNTGFFLFPLPFWERARVRVLNSSAQGEYTIQDRHLLILIDCENWSSQRCL